MGEWRESILVNILDTIESGQRPVGGATTVSGEIPSLGGENISSNGRLVLDNIKKIPIDYFKIMNKGKLVGYEVLINKDGANTGKVGYYNKDYENASINEHLFLLRGKADRVKQKYLYYSLLNNHGQIQIKNRITGSAQPGLSKEFVNYVKIYIPDNLYEQEKIAEILTTIDNTIEQTEKIIAKYRRIKQGLLQDLLTKGIDENGNIRSEATHEFKDSPLGRIPVEWDIVPINSIGKIITGNTPSTNDLGNFGGNYLFVTPSDISGKEICKTERTLTDKGMKFTRIVPKNSICVVCIGSTIGKIGIIKHECATNQQINTIICSENVDYNYIYYACLAYLKRQLDIEVGLQAVPIVNKNTFSTLLIPLMGKPEQVRISHILNKIDYSIKDEQKYYNKLKAIKQGLMQDLLSGKVRVTHLLDKGGKSDECHP